MTIREMHVTFREMAQQMGMQTTRAILNEDIDIVLNNSIIDKVREVLLQSLGPNPYDDKVIRQNAVIAPINAIRTLYRKGIINEDDIYLDDDSSLATDVNPYKINIDSNNIMLYTGFKVSYDGKSLYDCRIIEAEDLGQTLRDFCNRCAPDAPIAVIFGDKNSINVELYTGSVINTWEQTESFLKPKLIQYLYIKEPAKVKYSMDGKGDVDCDLPPYLHSEIVERGVSKYLISIGVTSGRNTQKSNNE